MTNATGNVPTPAPAPAPAPASTGHDLSKEEVANTFLDHKFDENGNHPYKEAVQLGRIFKDCLPDFVFSNTAVDPRLTCSGQPAFRITDKGKGMKCMSDHKEKNDVCTDQTCVFVSDISGAKLSLSKFADGEVHLARRNPNGNEKNQTVCEGLGIQHKSAATLRKQAEEDAKLRRENEIKLALQQVNQCRRSEDELAIARQANNFLRTVGKLDEAQSRRNERTFEDAELALLARRASRAKPDELQDVRSDLEAWMESHDRDCSKAVPIFREIAARYVNYRQSRSEREEGFSAAENYDYAKETIEEALEHRCMDERSMLALEDDSRMIDVGRVEKQMDEDIFNMGSAYADLYATRYNDALENCYGGAASQEGCISAQRAFEKTQKLQYYGSEIMQRQIQSAMAMQQMRMQFGSGGMLGGRTMIPGAVGGFYGSSGGGRSAFTRM